MVTSKTTASKDAIALVDKRPFFEKALCYGVRERIIDPLKCSAMITDGAKGTVQVAEHFGTSHLQADLENARRRIVSLVSLYLEDHSGGDLQRAAQSLQENSFLSHSRAGNAMLKQLYAMPETTISGDMKSLSLTEFQNERTLVKPYSLAAYRKEYKRRSDAEAVIKAAHWFCDELRISRDALDFVALEAVIRSAILSRCGGLHGLPNHGEFARLIETLRTSHASAGKLKIAKDLLDDIPHQHHAVTESVRRDIEKQDGILIANPKHLLPAVLQLLESRYFLRDADLDDVDGFAGFVSAEWHAATRGKDDPYSRLTMFMCLATGIKPKTSLTETEARTMIRKVRKHGFDSAAVVAFITQSAPFELNESLISQWESEFLPEAEQRILDDSDTSLQRALVFLKDNLNIKSSKKPAT